MWLMDDPAWRGTIANFTGCRKPPDRTNIAGYSREKPRGEQTATQATIIGEDDMKAIVRALACAIAVTGFAASAASAQSYPVKQIHIIVAYAAGGTGDVVARLLSDKLGAALGQSVVVENRAGASGAIGARTVAIAAPDGYTLLLGQTGEISINQHWLKNIGYDPDKELQPIALCSVVPLALVVPAKATYSTMPEFVALLKSGQPVSFASAGVGTPGFFAGEMLKVRLDKNMNHVPYKGAGPALNDLLGGHVDMYFPGFPAVTPQVKAGLLKLLAVSSGVRSPSAPDVPTVAEVTGIKNFDFTLWQGIFAPRGTPDAVVKRLNTEINKLLATDDIKTRFAELGADIRPMSIEQFTAFVQAESAKYVEVIKDSGAKPE
jgi:tripartite-type tricarboxylate transporter receptor subunit TctC